MISKIAIKNFKALKAVAVDLANLNLLVGLNGSGKSSFIQSLLLLRQSFNNAGLILQNGDLISLGRGKDVFYQYAGKEEKISFVLSMNEMDAQWYFDYVPTTDVLPCSKKSLPDAVASLNLFNQHFQYLNAEHIAPQENYPKSEYNVLKNKNIGNKGEYAAHYLSEYGNAEEVLLPNLQHPQANTTSLLHQINAWVSEVSPKIKFNPKDKGTEINLVVRFETKTEHTNEISLVNTGFGIGYAFPVVLAILKAQAGDILILENPESHLHPKGQSTIGRMLAYAAQAGVNIFVETHSDHIINGVRVAVKESKLSPENVKILHFDRVLDDYEQYVEIEAILIDCSGELSCYPAGFLDEWTEQLMKLL